MHNLDDELRKLYHVKDNHREWTQKEIAKSLEARVRKAKAIKKELSGQKGVWISTHPDAPLDLEIGTSFENLQKVVSTSLKRHTRTIQGPSVKAILKRWSSR